MRATTFVLRETVFAMPSEPIPPIIRIVPREEMTRILDEMETDDFNAMADEAMRIGQFSGITYLLSRGYIPDGFEVFFDGKYLFPPVLDCETVVDDEEVATDTYAVSTTQYRMVKDDWQSHPGFADVTVMCALLGDEATKPATKNTRVLLAAYPGSRPGPLRPYRPQSPTPLVNLPGGHVNFGPDGIVPVPVIHVPHARPPTFLALVGGLTVLRHHDPGLLASLAHQYWTDGSIKPVSSGVRAFRLNPATATMTPIPPGEALSEGRERAPGRGKYPLMVAQLLQLVTNGPSGAVKQLSDAEFVRPTWRGGG
uniref:Uncharacterized protein n=1 Tax=Exserohilum turcicum polymycovirus 1 TaxID=3229045 RepID=A0AAU7YCF2_9VIRU